MRRKVHKTSLEYVSFFVLQSSYHFLDQSNRYLTKTTQETLRSFPWNCTHFIPLSLSQEFLRRLSNCLLDSRLYNKWIEAVSDENSEEETKDKVVQLLKRLPSVNLLLLRHLLCLLHLIARHSSENKMCSMNLAVCIGPSILSSNSKISVDRREEVSKYVPKVICYLIDNWTTLFDPITTSDIMSSCPTRASTSSLNLDSTTPASQSSCEGTLSSSSSLTSTPSPVTTTTITPASISSPVSPPSYQQTMAKMAQIAHHYHQKQQHHQQLLLKQQHNQVIPTISPLVPVTVQPLVQVTAQHKVQQQVGQQAQQNQPMNYSLNNCTITNNNNNNNNNNVTTPKKVIQSTSSGEEEEEANEVVEKINCNLNNEKFCYNISNGDESGNISSNECSSNDGSTFIKSSNTSGRGSRSKVVNVEQRCAKDMTAEDWRKDIHCSVAYLRTLFNGSSPKSTSDVTTPMKVSSGLSLSQRDLNNRSIQVSNEIDNQNNNNNHNNTRKCLSTSRLMGERVSNFHHNHHRHQTGIIPSKSIITLVPIESSMTTPQTTTTTPTSSFGCHPSHKQLYHRRFVKNNNNHNTSNSNLMGNGMKNLSCSNNLKLSEKSNLMFRSSIDLASYKNSSSCSPLPNCNNNTFNQNNHHHNHLVTNSNKNINNIINLFNSYNTVNSGGGSNNDSYNRFKSHSHDHHHTINGVNHNHHSNSYNNNYLNNFNNDSYFNSKSNSRSGGISIYVSQNAINGKSGIVSIHNRTDSMSSFSGAEESYV